METESYIDDLPPTLARHGNTVGVEDASQDISRDMDWDLDSAHYSYIDDRAPTVWQLPHHGYVAAPPRSSSRANTHHRGPISGPAASYPEDEPRLSSGIKPIPGYLLEKLSQYTKLQERLKAEAAAAEKKNTMEAIARDGNDALEVHARRKQTLNELTEHTHEGPTRVKKKDHKSRHAGEHARADTAAEKQTPPSKHGSTVIRVMSKNGEEAFVEVTQSPVRDTDKHLDKEKVDRHDEDPYETSHHRRSTLRRKRGKRKKSSTAHEANSTYEEAAEIADGVLMSGALHDEPKSSRTRLASRKSTQASHGGLSGFFEDIRQSLHSVTRHSRKDSHVSGERSLDRQSRRFEREVREPDHHSKEPAFVSFEEVGAAWCGDNAAEDSKKSTPKKRSKASTTRNLKGPSPGQEEIVMSSRGSRHSRAVSAFNPASVNGVDEAAGDIDAGQSARPSQRHETWEHSQSAFEQPLGPDDSISAVLARASKRSRQEKWAQHSAGERSHASRSKTHSRKDSAFWAASTRKSQEHYSDQESQDPMARPSSSQHDRAPESRSASTDWQTIPPSQRSRVPSAGTFEEVGLRWHDPFDPIMGSRVETLASKLDNLSTRDWALPVKSSRSVDKPPPVSEHGSRSVEHSTRASTADQHGEHPSWRDGYSQRPRQSFVRSRDLVAGDRSARHSDTFHDSSTHTALRNGSRHSSERSRSQGEALYRATSTRRSARAADSQHQPGRSAPHHSPTIRTAGADSVQTPHPQQTRNSTIFAGKGWISPHPLSTDELSPPDSRIVLPSDAFVHGATMTYDQWKEIQERGLRMHRNFSTTESSQGRTAKLRDGRHRFAGWGDQTSDGYRFEQEAGADRTTSGYRPPTVTSEHSSDRTETIRRQERLSHHEPESERRTPSQRWSYQQSGTAPTRSTRAREIEVMEEGRNVWSAMPAYEQSERRRRERRESSYVPTSQLYWQRYPEAEED